MIIDLDIGNTFTKWRLLENGVVIGRGQVDTFADWEQDARFPSLASVTTMRVSCVAGPEKRKAVADLARHNKIDVRMAQTEASFGKIKCAYQDPASLGVDRWLGVIASYHYVGGPCCVVDCGSAITVDFVKHDGRHVGGYIVPGIRLMKQSLKLGTRSVPIDEAESAGTLQSPGQSTYDAVNHGVYLMACSLIAQAYDTFAKTEAVTPHLLLCGGDAGLIDKGLSVPALFRPELVFEGLELMFPL